MAQYIVRVEFGIIFPSNVRTTSKHDAIVAVLRQFEALGSRSYSDETSRHVGYKAAALAKRSDEPPAKKSAYHVGVGGPTISAFPERSCPLQKNNDRARSIDKAIAYIIKLD